MDYDFDLRTKGEKIADTKREKKEAAEKFPIGEMVKQKYVNSVGLVASDPKPYKSLRKTKFLVEVLWMHHDWYEPGTTEYVAVDKVIKFKQKKVVES